MHTKEKEYALSTLQNIDQGDVDKLQEFVASQAWPIYYLRAVTGSLGDRVLNNYPILPKADFIKL
ncbi:hypothetical protein ES703_65348 [subsurface metagenome]